MPQTRRTFDSSVDRSALGQMVLEAARARQKLPIGEQIFQVNLSFIEDQARQAYLLFSLSFLWKNIWARSSSPLASWKWNKHWADHMNPQDVMPKKKSKGKFESRHFKGHFRPAIQKDKLVFISKNLKKSASQLLGLPCALLPSV